mmetsp:Transcript_73085/g.65762  ORF Transcript_73085/g.65762 Transcript_73085/m.65762 type:complete len:83 (+) Transcript_73085:2-250(+)
MNWRQKEIDDQVNKVFDYTLASLEAESNYAIFVTAANRYGYGSKSKIMTFKTKVVQDKEDDSDDDEMPILEEEEIGAMEEVD